MQLVAGQRSFDDLGSPLHGVTFCVVDLETTGGSAVDCAITEIGAVRLRGGECLGTFQTLVNPGRGIPPSITYLTGITDAMVTPAPRIDEVLPTHRALDDALATGELLHMLLERAASFGVLGLDDLVALPKLGGHPQAAKLRLTAQLPRAPGVYIFRDRAGRALYVGKATNLRSR